MQTARKMQIKLFGKADKKQDGSCLRELEGEINHWLKENLTIKIVNILQSASGGSLSYRKIFITVWYEELP